MYLYISLFHTKCTSDGEKYITLCVLDPPGPIENNKISVNKGGQVILKTNSDYGQLSEEMWRFLHTIYGGGPEVYVKQSPPPAPTLAEVKLSAESAEYTPKVVSEVKA